MSAILRQALRSDIPEIWRVRYAVLENTLAPGKISGAELIQHLEVVGRGWVIDTGATIAGFAIGNAQTGNIWALFVDPVHEGKGYGRRLHDEMLRWLWSQGLEQLWLTTGSGTRAQRFYERNGWQDKGADGDGDVRFEMLAP
jgi:GNAT superfamily N-acetyltransferase